MGRQHINIVPWPDVKARLREIIRKDGISLHDLAALRGVTKTCVHDAVGETGDNKTMATWLCGHFGTHRTGIVVRKNVMLERLTLTPTEGIILPNGEVMARLRRRDEEARADMKRSYHRPKENLERWHEVRFFNGRYVRDYELEQVGVERRLFLFEDVDARACSIPVAPVTGPVPDGYIRIVPWSEIRDLLDGIVEKYGTVARLARDRRMNESNVASAIKGDSMVCASLLLRAEGIRHVEYVATVMTRRESPERTDGMGALVSPETARAELLQFIRDSGLSEYEFAKRAGCSKALLWLIRKGRSLPSKLLTKVGIERHRNVFIERGKPK